MFITSNNRFYRRMRSSVDSVNIAYMEIFDKKYIYLWCSSMFGSLFWLDPGAYTEDLIEVKRDLALLNQTLHLGPHSSGQDPHQSLGSKPVLGSLLVVSLGHVGEHLVSSLVDVVDDLTQVGLEVLGGQTLEVVEGCWGNVSLPLQVTLASLHQLSQTWVLIDEVNKAALKLQILGGDGTLARGRQSNISLLISLDNLSGSSSSLSHVGSEDNDVEVLVDVVHDLGLEEGLGSVIHDLVGQLGLGNVLSQLLDASASSLLGSVQVNDLVSIVLGSHAISHLTNQLLDNLELSSEESVLALVHHVLVSLEDAGIDAGHSLNQTLVAGRDLELFEETGDDTGSGGSAQTNLIVDDDRGVDAGANQGVAHDVEVRLLGGSRVADRDPPVNQTRILLLQTLNHLAQTLQFLNLNLRLFLVDVHNLQLATIDGLPALDLLQEVELVGLDDVPGDVSQLSVLSNLVGRSGTHRFSIDIHIRLLPHVEPDDGAILGVVGGHLLQTLLEASQGWLTTTVDLESRNSSEVRNSRKRIWQLLDFIKMIQHTNCVLHVPHPCYKEGLYW